MRLGAAIAAILLVACGGGGGAPAKGTILPAVNPRTDLYFTYFGGNAVSVSETSDHTNLVWAADFYGPLEQLAALTQAKGSGQKAVLMLPAALYDLPVAETRFYLQRIANAGLLDVVIAVAPLDEPNTARSGNRSDVEVRTKNIELRTLFLEFPQLDRPKLAVFYACRGVYGGIREYDWVGCDDYDSGCAVFDTYYTNLRSKMSLNAREMVIAGGSFGQDPACFEVYAQRNAQVAVFAAFIRQTVTDGKVIPGIRENPTLRLLYCQTGRRIIGSTVPC